MHRQLLAVVLVSGTVCGAAFAGDVTGSVYFKGTPPKPKRIVMTGDPRCSTLSKEPAYTEDVIVNSNGTLRNVIVSVKSGPASPKTPPPGQKVSLDQRGCRYVPHVLALMIGQTLEVVNEDPTLHNVHTLSSANAAFNIAQPKQGMKLDRTFTRAETFKVKCEVHPWMSAYIGVFDTPYYFVTGEDGSFTLKGLPPGEYVLEAWHERYGTRTVTVKVPAKGVISTSIDFTLH